MENLSKEQIFDKLMNALLTEEMPSQWLERLRGEDCFDRFFPELRALIGVPQNQIHHREGDVWTHTLLVADQAAKRRDIVKNPAGFMLSALCHDFGKAVATEETDGVIHSYRHEKEGLPLVRSFLERFTEDRELIDYVLNMTEYHMTPNIMAEARSRLKSTNRLFDSSAEPFDLIQLSICDGLGKLPQNNNNEDFLMERYEMFREVMARPYVTEKELKEAGVLTAENRAELLSYANKLRLAGCTKENSMRQCIAYSRKEKKNK